MTDRVGQKFGNYRLTRLLGEGGFAQVYLGEHLHLATLVAVKLLHTKFVTREQEEFLREARTIASLEHPSIVRVLDCGIEAGQNEPFIIMQYAPHGTLRQRHPKGARLSPPTIMEYVQQVASALQYAHDSKLIHRDIKPENMLLGAKDELLLSDFGIALISSSSSSQSTKATAGTVAYMAPEQIVGKPRTASDQYALGIVVYEWLSGTAPFRGSFAEMCAQHLHAPPPSLCELLPWLDPGVEHVVMKALAKEPQERFATVRDFAAALEQSLQLQRSSLPVAKVANVPGIPVVESVPDIAHVDGIDAASIVSEVLSNPPADTITAHNDTDPSISEPLIATLAADESTLVKAQISITPPLSEEEQLTQITATRDTPLLASTLPPSTNNRFMPLQPAFGDTPVQPPLVRRKRRLSNGLVVIFTLILAILLITPTVAYFSISHSLANSQGHSSTPSSTHPSQATQGLASQSTSTPTILPTATSTPQPVESRLSAVQTASQAVNATGQGETLAMHATGSVRITNHEQASLTLNAGSIFQNRSTDAPVQIKLDTSVTAPGCFSNICYDVDVNITVIQAGTVGNVMRKYFRYCSDNLCGANNQFTIENSVSAFTGGTDPYAYTYVQQSDINNAASPLISSTTSQAQTDIQNQVKSNEHLVGTPQCQSNTTANHAAGDKVSTVTVTVTTTCTATAST